MALQPRTLALARTWLVWAGLMAAAVSLYRCGSASADAPGVAQPRDYKVASLDMGRLQSIDVREGETVLRGQVIARLDTREIDAQIAVARADLARTDVSVPAAAVGLDTDAFAARRGLQSEAEQAEVELTTLRTTVERDRAELAAVSRELAQEQDLLNRGLVRGDHANELLLRRSALEQGVQGAPERLQAANRRASAARERLVEWDRRFSARGAGVAGDARTARLQPLRADVEEKRVLLANLEQKRRQADIVAPADGMVQTIVSHAGDVVRPGDPMVVLVEKVANQVIAYVGERSGIRIGPGTPVVARRRVALSTAALGDSIQGVVTGVSGAVAQLPARFWPNPQVPVYGREVYVRLDRAREFAPGEALDLRFGASVPAAPTAVAERSVETEAR